MGLTLVIDGAIADPDREAAFVADVKDLIGEYVDDLSTVTITTDHSGSPDLLAEARADAEPEPEPVPTDPPVVDPPAPPGTEPPVTPAEPPTPSSDLEGRVTYLEEKVDAIATQVDAIATAVGADTADDDLAPELRAQAEREASMRRVPDPPPSGNPLG